MKPNFCSNCGEKFDTYPDTATCPRCHATLHEHSEPSQPNPSIAKRPRHRMKDKNKQLIILGVVLGVGIPIIVTMLVLVNQVNNRVTQTYNQAYTEPFSDCKGQMDSVTNLAQSWFMRWTAATEDPGGQLRAEGRAVSEQASNLLNYCSGSLDDQSRTGLSQIRDVISAQIENNIDYGPPCDPQCKSGPPVT